MNDPRQQQAEPAVSVVIVTYNSLGVIAECLATLDSPDLQLIIVDNASTDGTAEFVEAQAPRAKVIRARENVGFAAGVHLGVEHATSATIALLNPDAVASSGSLLELARRLNSDPLLGAVAPIVVQPDGRLRIVSAGRTPTLWRMFTHYSGLSRLGRTCRALEGHYLLPDQVADSRDVDWATGACLVISREAWSTTGGLSTRWFMYAEDIEFCWRLKQSGFSVRIYPDLVVSHLVGASETGHASKINSAWVTTLFDFYRSDLSHNYVTTLLWKIIVAGGLLSRSIIYSTLALRDATKWSWEAERFRAHARALLKAVSR
jgi:GT2 family glycosyltransferase